MQRLSPRSDMPTDFAEHTDLACLTHPKAQAAFVGQCPVLSSVSVASVPVGLVDEATDCETAHADESGGDEEGFPAVA